MTKRQGLDNAAGWLLGEEAAMIGWVEKPRGMAEL
jgi:hypothetical protein